MSKSKKPKAPKPSPAQQQLEQLQLKELRRQEKEIADLKAFTAARNRPGRRSLIATSGAGTEASFRVGNKGREGAARDRSLIEGLSGSQLEAEIRRRGAVTTRTINRGPQFGPGGKNTRNRNDRFRGRNNQGPTTETLINFGSL